MVKVPAEQWVLAGAKSVVENPETALFATVMLNGEPWEFIPFHVPLKGILAKEASADLAASIVKGHVPVPEQAPLQPLKDEKASGVSDSVTAVPLVSVAEQVPPQEIAAGAEVTVPAPVPDLETVSGQLLRAKVAETLALALIVRVHRPDPVQAPLQLEKTEDAFGVADRTTTVP